MPSTKNIVLFDTSIGSQNLGDYIINECIEKELSYLLDDCFCVRFPTHTPVSGLASRLFGGEAIRMCRKADYKFLCGTNLLSNSMVRPHPNWSVSILDCSPYAGSVCLGVGSAMVRSRFGLYENLLYKRILSSRYIHSVRDERTERVLTDMGFRALNTGCPTTWSLRQGEVEKAYVSEARRHAALFTLTDYAPDKSCDTHILDCLFEKYEKVFFWPQGSGDLDYIKELGYYDRVEIVPPTLPAYRRIMSEPFDYVGTRLHGGVYALSHGHRTIIIAVDHRAKDMAKTSGIPVVSRGDFSALSKALEFDRPPDLHIPHDKINQWKAQFSA